MEKILWSYGEGEEEYWKKDGLVEDAVEEILNTVGDDDSDTSEEELEPDNDDVHYHSTGSASPAQTPKKEKPCCSHQLQLEHTQLPQDLLNICTATDTVND